MSTPSSGRIVVPNVGCHVCGATGSQVRATGKGFKCRDAETCRRRKIAKREKGLDRAARAAHVARQRSIETVRARLSVGPVVRLRRPRAAAPLKAANLQYLHPDGFTHEEIAAELGVSRGRIQQIEAKALDKFRRAAKRFGIDVEDVLG